MALMKALLQMAMLVTQGPALTPEQTWMLRDTEFARIQEDTVYAWAKPARYDQVLPTKHARLLRALGCGHGDCRAVAEDELARLGFSAVRALVWGAKSQDAEVATRCERLWTALFTCDRCGGSGNCPCGGKRTDCRMCNWQSLCNRCEGTGDVRFRVAYDYAVQNYVLFLKDPFDYELKDPR